MLAKFRRKYLRFIYGPIVIFFIKTLSLFYTRRTIQRMVKSFIRELNSSKVSRIRIVYNFADSPHTFGDFMVVVMLCRFLALSKHKPLLTVVDSTRRSDWIELNEKLQNDRINDLISLARHLLPEAVKVELVKNYLPMSSEINLDSKSFYAAAPYFLDLLISKYKWDIPENFLLGPTSNYTGEPYIAWHVRQAIYDFERNSTPSAIKEDFRVLQNRFPEHSVMIISDSTGLENTFQVLTGSSETKTQIVGGTKVLAQPMQGFQNAIPAVLRASFYFQRGGGGIGVAAIFSSVPYINLCPSKSYFHGRRGGRVAPWANEHQHFLYVKKNLQLFSIAKLLKNLKA